MRAMSDAGDKNGALLQHSPETCAHIPRRSIADYVTCNLQVIGCSSQSAP